MNILRNINRDKYQFDFLIFSDEKDGFYDEVLSLGCRVFYVPSRRAGIINYHKNLNRFFSLHADEYEVVHLNGMSLTTIAPLYYSKKYGVKKRIMHVHGATWEGIHNKIFHNLNKLRISQIANYWLGCSQEALEWGFGRMNCYDKSIIIKNGIDLEKFKYIPETRSQIRAFLNISPGTLVLGHVGRFNVLKNHDYLIDVFRLVHENKIDSKLICVGEGELLDTIKRKVEDYGLDNDIIFLGNVDNVPEILHAFDIFVFPSISEGLGFVALEAQANGLPTIASTGVPSEVMVSDNFIRLPLVDDYKYWADKIIEMAKSGRHEINKDSQLFEFSINKTIKQIESIYSA